MVDKIEGIVQVLVGAVGCFYGLDLVSHFYAANKPVVSLPLAARALIGSDLTEKRQWIRWATIILG